MKYDAVGGLSSMISSTLRLSAPAGTRFARIPELDTTELVAGPIELDPGRSTITVHLLPEARGERSGVINLRGTEGFALDVIAAAAGPVMLTVSDDLGWIPPTECGLPGPETSCLTHCASCWWGMGKSKSVGRVSVTFNLLSCGFPQGSGKVAGI